jgi:hypothetical protein
MDGRRAADHGGEVLGGEDRMSHRGWTATQRADWRELVERLDDELPASKPVRVRRTRVAGCHGHCIDEGAYYQIEISSRRHYTDAIYDLCEEWAHAIAGITGREQRDHSIVWGLAYSACVQLMLRGDP